MSHFFSRWFFCLAVFLVLSSAQARAGEADKWDKFLPDDTDSIISINVKQILSSPLYTKNYQKKVEEFLKKDEVQNLLKVSSIDPVRDIDRLVMAHGEKYVRSKVTPFKGGTNVSTEVGALFILQGRFDPAKFKANGEKLAKDSPGLVVIHKVGDVPVLEIIPHKDGTSIFEAVLSKDIAVASAYKGSVFDAVEKAVGKNKTQLKYAGLKKLLDVMDPKETIFVGAIGAMVWEHGFTLKDGVVVPDAKSNKTLEESVGVQAIHGSFNVDAVVKGRVAITAKDGWKAKEMAKSIEGAFKKMAEELKTQPAEIEKTMGPLVEVAISIRPVIKDQTVSMEAKMSPEAIESFIRLIRDASKKMMEELNPQPGELQETTGPVFAPQDAPPPVGN